MSQKLMRLFLIVRNKSKKLKRKGLEWKTFSVVTLYWILPAQHSPWQTSKWRGGTVLYSVISFCPFLTSFCKGGKIALLPLVLVLYSDHIYSQSEMKLRYCNMKMIVQREGLQISYPVSFWTKDVCSKFVIAIITQQGGEKWQIPQWKPRFI